MRSRCGLVVPFMFVGLAIATLIAPPPAIAGYIFQTIDAPGASGGTFAAGVNANGLVSGYYVDASGAYHGFIWQNGTLTPVDYTGVPGVVSTFLFQDNSSGQVAGYYTGSDGNSHSLIYNSATSSWTTVPDAPGGYPFNAAGGINDNGQLAGNYSTDPTASSKLVGWLYTIKTNTYTPFTNPNANAYGTATYGMNNNGDIAGLYYDSGGSSHGFVWDPTTGSRTVDVPGAQQTQAFAINDADTVAGGYFNGSAWTGFLLDSSNNLTSVMVPGATNTWIAGLNDQGDISGFYEDAAGGFHAFYGQAVPEPGSLVLALTGVLLVGAYARGRSRRRQDSPRFAPLHDECEGTSDSSAFGASSA
jgi:probable HAF family extracellular repeat protein